MEAKQRQHEIISMVLLVSVTIIEIAMIFVMSFIEFKYFSIIGFFVVPHIILTVIGLYLLAVYFCQMISNYGKTASFIQTLTLQLLVLTVFQPLYYIFGTIVQLSGPYGRTLYYPDIGTWFGQFFFIIALFAPFFVLYYAVRRMNLEVYAQWEAK